jgi:GNAT superfamily N-acetyltransferase
MVRDLPMLKDLDLKTYDYPMNEAQWQHIQELDAMYIVTIGKRDIGFTVLEACDDCLNCHRLGVLRRFRGQGVGKYLLNEAVALARDLHKPKLTTVIPEINCLPGHPDDVSLWLKWQGFRAFGVKRNLFYMYGECVDGILFAKEV